MKCTLESSVLPLTYSGSRVTLAVGCFWVSRSRMGLQRGGGPAKQKEPKGKSGGEGPPTSTAKTRSSIHWAVLCRQWGWMGVSEWMSERGLYGHAEIASTRQVHAEMLKVCAHVCALLSLRGTNLHELHAHKHTVMHTNTDRRRPYSWALQPKYQSCAV